jgi:signal transduction histidine kinase
MVESFEKESFSLRRFLVGSISKKLILAFGFFLVLLIFMIYYILSINQQISIDQTYIREVNSPLELMVEQVSSYDVMLTSTVYASLIHAEVEEWDLFDEHKITYDSVGVKLDDLLKIDAPKLVNKSRRNLQEKQEVYDLLFELDRINLALVNLERGAFDAIEKGDFEKARSLVAGEDYHSYKLQLGDLYSKWQLVEAEIVERYRQRVLVNSNYIEKYSLLLGVIFVLFAILIPFMIYRSISRPLNKLSLLVEELERGNFKARINIKSNDEVGALGLAFNKMAEQLQEAQEDLEKKVRERTRELYYTQLDLERRTRQANQAKVATLNILEDIEESKGKLDEAFHQLKALEKLKNNFLSFTTHELKTPLTPILIQAQMLQEGDFGKLTSEQKKSIDLIVRNMRTLNQLIGDVLDISVIQSANLKIFPIRANMVDIIRQIVANAEPLARQKNIKISIKLPQLHSVLVDVRRIGQVIANLLNNAIKFTPEGGLITIEAQENSEEVLVRVIDTGIGIPKDKLNTLFQPFSQVVASYTLKQKGTGLGLAICKGIINAHNGKIGVQSEPGKGSIFYFSLPRKSHFGGNKG